MITTAISPIRPNFRDNRLLQGLSVWYLIVWIWAAISPHDRFDWLLENVLIFIFFGTLMATYRKFPLSDLTYIFITVYMTLHTIGSHYTYSEVPLGFWLKQTLALSRNPFDRIVHFCFGLLLAYPIREVFLRVVNTRGFWTYYLPLDVTMAFSCIYEIIEAAVVWTVNPELGDAYLGTQGDVWDAQKICY
jgi:putative membrane protein